MRPWQRKCYDFVIQEYFITRMHGPRISLINVWGPVIGKSWLIDRLEKDSRLEDYLVVDHKMDDYNDKDVDNRITALIFQAMMDFFENTMIVMVTRERLVSRQYAWNIVHFTREEDEL